MSNCFCLEFSFSKVAHYELSYVDCSGNTVTDTYQSGITYNICSEDFEPIVNCFDIDFEVKGLCINGECPGEYFQLKNECDVVTIFPLGVNCVVQNPTSNGSYDGIASLFISGGTPPYIINWENGNYSQTLTNLGSGQYNAVVTDFYGDFTANTTCVLLAPSPTPTMTPTPTPTPTPVVNNLCLIVKRKIGKNTFTDLYDFTYNGFYNGFPTWTSSPPGYDIVWMSGSSQWEVSGWTNGSLVNSNSSVPPVVGWTSFGSGINTGGQITFVDVEIGSCASQDILSYELTINNPTCQIFDNEGNCTGDGSIIFNIIDGVPPYQYTIDGFTYFTNQPIFQNLCAGSYPTSVTDASGQTYSLPATLLVPSSPQLYTVQLSLNFAGNNFNITVTPQLPPGITITFDLVHVSEFSVQPNIGAATYNNLVTLNVNGTPTPYTTVSSTGTGALLPSKVCSGGNVTNTETTYVWQNVTMSQGTVVNGTVTDIIVPITPLVACYDAKGSYSIYLDNVSINNCLCCSVSVVNPPIILNEVG